MHGKPKGLGRDERRSRLQSRETSTPLQEEYIRPSGAFGSMRAPKLVGVSDTVRLSNRDLARRASREMRRWQRTLPKGVKI